MWENAAPVPPPQAGTRPHKKRQPDRPEEDVLIWGQLLLCLALLILVILARTLQWPVYTEIRIAFREVMQPEQSTFLSDDRFLSKFTEQAVQTIGRVMQNWDQGAPDVSTAETARRQVHGKAPETPAGARLECFQPNFSLVFPLAGRACTRTSRYGWRTDPMGGSGSDFHLGNDLAAAEGTAVLAAASGTVRCAGVHNSYGNYVRIVHEDGDETLYAHMQYLFVHTGQEVSAGDCLGTVGETGNATGPHLHFELLHKGIRYDPSEALQTAS